MAVLNPVRSGIKIDIIVQSMNQIHTLYINDSGAIINNCDRIICMGTVNEAFKCKQGQVKSRIAKKIFA